MYIPNQNPLNININPPGLQSGMPGETIKIHIVVTNNGDIDAVINLFLNLDEELQTLIGTSNSERQSISLSPNESSNEITFELPLPVNASPGTYDYTLVVDSPEHYPQHTPINCPSQIKILFKEQTRVGLNDPTFFIKPSTNPHKPLIFKSGEPLQLEVQVINNSDRVDRFRLNCPDLDEDWFTINYPKTGLESEGLTEVNALELNNKSQATILLQLHPPKDALEGNYNPAIRLYSENYPDLVLLDLVYTRIPPNYRLDVDLETVLGQVSYRSGEYILSIINQGNLIRELIFNAKTRDEYEICKYDFNPTQVKLLPLAETEVNLRVKPRGWWRRPWLGAGRTINFQVELEDKQSYKLPDKQIQAILTWKSRPIWQFLLLLLFALGIFGVTAFIVWRLLNPEPLKIQSFSASKSQIEEGKDIQLNWEITQYNQLKKLDLIAKEPDTPQSNFLEGDFRKKLESLCKKENNTLKCTNIDMGRKGIVGEYTFDLQAQYRAGGLPFSRKTNQKINKQTKVIVKEKQIAEVVNFGVVNNKYTKGQNILLNWKIKNYTLLESVQISGKTADGKALKPLNLSFKNGLPEDSLLQENCQQLNDEQALECNNIPIPALSVGSFAYKINAYSKDINNRNSEKENNNAVEVLPKNFKIISFLANGKQSLEIEEGKQVILGWKVQADSSEDVQVDIDCVGSNLPLTGEKSIFVTNPQCKLQVTDIFNKLKPQYQVINVKVKPKPQPIPTVTVPAPDSTPNNSTNNNLRERSNNSRPKTNSRRNTAIPLPDIEDKLNSQQTDRSI